MADMTYEITINVPVKITLSSEERAEAIAYGLKRGLIFQEDIDRGYDALDYDVLHERAIMGRDEEGERFRLMRDEVKDAVSDWLDEQTSLGIISSAEDVTAYEEED
jgi:hypothetical protein